MPSAAAVADLILNDLALIPNTTDPGVAKRQSIEAIVTRVRAMVLAADVSVPGTGLAAPSGGGPVTGTAAGTIA